MNERIKSLRKSLSMTQEEFSKRIGLSRNFIAQVEIGTKTPSDRTISDICREFNVNEEWLRTGNGKMLKSRTREQEIGAFVNEVMELNDNSFEKKLVSALARLEPKDWECLESIAKKLLDEK
nr:MAG TPA: helix-turn-helix domain protein [Caudoviricetes sp.]